MDERSAKSDVHGKIEFYSPQETMSEIDKAYEKAKHLYLLIASLNQQLELLESKIPMIVYRINELKSTIK